MEALPASSYRCHILVVALLLVGAACAHRAETSHTPLTLGDGRFVWGDPAPHEEKRPAYHTRCGSDLHVWVRDTVSPELSTYMVVAVLGFEGRTHEVPAYADIDGRRVGEEVYAGVYAPGHRELAKVVGRLRFDSVTDDYVSGQLSGDLVRQTRWDQKPDTGGTLLLDFRAPRRRDREQYLCHGPRM